MFSVLKNGKPYKRLTSFLTATRNGEAMEPLSLELEGFTGIRSASGKDKVVVNFEDIPKEARTVALIGPNGSSKTTILDNMHPYPVMPSRSTTVGTGGFSYWDHVCLPLAKKTFYWKHNGEKYKSIFIFKSTGKTEKAEYFLLYLNNQTNEWSPVRDSNGNESDGKISNYSRCLEQILGNPETFFTSVFSSQNKKSIASYGATEFKAILANILNLEHLRALSAKASQVGKLLRFHLDELQDGMSQARNAELNVVQVELEVKRQEQLISNCLNNESAAAIKLDSTKLALTQLETKRNSQVKDVAQKDFLDKQLVKINDDASAKRSQVIEHNEQSLSSFVRANKQARIDLLSKKDEIVTATGDLQRLKNVIAMKEEIVAAEVNVESCKRKVTEIDSQILLGKQKIVDLPLMRQKLQQLKIQESNLITTGSGKRVILVAQQKTSELISQVPCNEMNISEACPLLKEAFDAQKSLVQKQAEINEMIKSYHALSKTIAEDEAAIKLLNDVELQLSALTDERNVLTSQMQSLTALASQRSILDNAIERAPVVFANLQVMADRTMELQKLIEKNEGEIQKLESTQAIALKAISDEANNQTAIVNDQLLKLDLPVKDSEINFSKNEVALATSRLDQSRVLTEQARTTQVGLLAKVGIFKDLLEKSQLTIAKSECITEEIAYWKLIEKGTGNDGLIALSIDDAGPAIATICNDLLRESFGGRFTLKIETQKESASGAIKETLLVKVFDNHRGEEKNFDFVSGGECVWINEALTRAIALYKGQCSGVQYDTLFTDEADGPLDPDKKIEFMAMKKHVLRLGGYSREYFVSQTPEISNLADYQLNVLDLYK